MYIYTIHNGWPGSWLAGWLDGWLAAGAAKLSRLCTTARQGSARLGTTRHDSARFSLSLYIYIYVYIYRERETYIYDIYIYIYIYIDNNNNNNNHNNHINNHPNSNINNKARLGTTRLLRLACLGTSPVAPARAHRTSSSSYFPELSGVAPHVRTNSIELLTARAHTRDRSFAHYRSSKTWIQSPLVRGTPRFQIAVATSAHSTGQQEHLPQMRHIPIAVWKDAASKLHVRCLRLRASFFCQDHAMTRGRGVVLLTGARPCGPYRAWAKEVGRGTLAQRGDYVYVYVYIYIYMYTYHYWQ